MAPVVSIQRDAPKKKALLVAVSYSKLHREHPKESPPFILRGAHRDPPRLKKLLTEMYGYDEGNIVVLMDDGHHAEPTEDRMRKELKNLVHDAQSGDHLVFSFSGHGSQITNKDQTEEDGMDEVIWPSDVEYDPTKPDDEKVIGSLDEQWNSPVNSPVSPMSNALHRITHPEAEGKVTPKRGMSIDTIKALSRASTMTMGNQEKTNGVRGISRNIRMPYSSRGSIATNPFTGEQTIQETESIDKRTVPKQEQKELPFLGLHAWMINLALIPSMAVYSHTLSTEFFLSWSACMDDQLGLDSFNGGILTHAFDGILRETRNRTNKEMLNELRSESFDTLCTVSNIFDEYSKRLFQFGKEAKHAFRAHNWGELPQPKPSLGSIRPLETIYDDEFSF
ncbi:peptidase C14 [Sanghuangporus baumii]|uniref:Peptidase C14 n=1 Tax=Sanghuangporus baumii TaxID=108892 RepID=A0A9Q5N7U2_SANBA|nr:peptidase C14 [Sanghuangporus baumii]